MDWKQGCRWRGQALEEGKNDAECFFICYEKEINMSLY